MSAHSTARSLWPPLRLVSGEAPSEAVDEAPGWALPQLAGRLTELSGDGASAALTAAVGVARQAQAAGELVAWVLVGAPFFPPDAVTHGLELATLPVIRAPDAAAAGQAAEVLLRSGAFGLTVLDLGASAGLEAPLLHRPALLSRLSQLARHHGVALVVITHKPPESPSLGSLVSLRAQVTRRPLARGLHACALEVLKDKRRGPGWRHTEVVDGPPGLR